VLTPLRDVGGGHKRLGTLRSVPGIEKSYKSSPFLEPGRCAKKSSQGRRALNSISSPRLDGNSISPMTAYRYYSDFPTRPGEQEKEKKGHADEGDITLRKGSKRRGPAKKPRDPSLCSRGKEVTGVGVKIVWEGIRTRKTIESLTVASRSRAKH